MTVGASGPTDGDPLTSIGPKLPVRVAQSRMFRHTLGVVQKIAVTLGSKDASRISTVPPSRPAVVHIRPIGSVYASGIGRVPGEPVPSAGLPQALARFLPGWASFRSSSN